MSKSTNKQDVKKIDDKTQAAKLKKKQASEDVTQENGSDGTNFEASGRAENPNYSLGYN